MTCRRAGMEQLLKNTHSLRVTAFSQSAPRCNILIAECMQRSTPRWMHATGFENGQGYSSRAPGLVVIDQALRDDSIRRIESSMRSADDPIPQYAAIDY
jgi:hypothetical protein